METIELILLMFCHLVGMYLLNISQMYKKDYNNNLLLLQHSLFYLIPFFLFLFLNDIMPYFKLNENYVEWTLSFFIIITYTCHYFQFYIFNRICHKLYKKDKKNLIKVIKYINQVLCFLQIFITYYLIFK